jgi:hypothetical protein
VCVLRVCLRTSHSPCPPHQDAQLRDGHIIALAEVLRQLPIVACLKLRKNELTDASVTALLATMRYQAENIDISNSYIVNPHELPAYEGQGYSCPVCGTLVTFRRPSLTAPGTRRCGRCDTEVGRPYFVLQDIDIVDSISVERRLINFKKRFHADMMETLEDVLTTSSLSLEDFEVGLESRCCSSCVFLTTRVYVLMTGSFSLSRRGWQCVDPYGVASRCPGACGDLCIRSKRVCMTCERTGVPRTRGIERLCPLYGDAAALHRAFVVGSVLWCQC